MAASTSVAVPSFNGAPRLVYACVTLNLMVLACIAINSPCSAMQGVLTTSAEGRASASGYRFVMTLWPVFIIFNTAIPMAEYFGGSDPHSAKGWQMTIGVMATAPPRAGQRH